MAKFRVMTIEEEIRRYHRIVEADSAEEADEIKLDFPVISEDFVSGEIANTEVTPIEEQRPKLTLVDALDAVYGHTEWDNPFRPYFSSNLSRITPYEAYIKLSPQFQAIVDRLIGHKPTKDEE